MRVAVALPAASADGRRSRSELRGTLAIVALMVAIAGLGWLTSAVIGRERANLSPGVSILLPKGESMPTGHVGRYRWRIGGSQLTVVPRAADATEAELEAFRTEVVDTLQRPVTFQAPEEVEHGAGTAFQQRWDATGGEDLEGALLVVVREPLAVLFDARWPTDEDPAVLAEIHRVIDSLRIEPLGP